MKIKLNNEDRFVIYQFKTGGVEAMFVNLANKLRAGQYILFYLLIRLIRFNS